jgi:hypothetical protein
MGAMLEGARYLKEQIQQKDIKNKVRAQSVT